MTPYAALFRQQFATLTAGMSQCSGRYMVRQAQAYGLLHGILQQQAYFRAYVDMFCWTALISGCVRSDCMPAQDV
jgi:hypothetical protein